MTAHATQRRLQQLLALDSLLHGADVLVTISVDVDADVGYEQRSLEHRLTSASDALFGIQRGVPRLLELFGRYGIHATFYVPGEVADVHPAAVEGIAASGHELGHHGYAHLFPDRATTPELAEEFERGRAALARLVGAPRGYRSPGWELTPEALEMVRHGGYTWDSSLMADDRPYKLTADVIEFPVHWSLDDWPFYGFTRDAGGLLSSPTGVLETWIEEFESARDERRHLTLTVHPECSGRGYRSRLLARFIEHAISTGRTKFISHGDLADSLSNHTP